MTTPEVARLLGVTSTTVIRWVEQGRLECAVTPGGHRRFARGEVERFRRAQGGQSDDMVFRFLHDLLQGGDVYSLQSKMLEMRGQLGAWWRVADVLGATLNELGRQWEQGSLGISQEHTATRRFQQALWGCIAGLPSPPPSPLCLLATAEGDNHTLGLNLVEICLREAGWSSLWLGSPTPTPVLIQAIEGDNPHMVAISASACSRDAAMLEQQYRTVAGVCRQIGAALVLGGEGAWPAKPATGHRVRSFEDFAGLLAETRSP